MTRGQVYFDGQFYYAKEAVFAGESPVTAPEKWVALPIPAELKPIIAMDATAAILDGLSQGERARALRRDASMALQMQVNAAAGRTGFTANLPVRQ